MVISWLLKLYLKIMLLNLWMDTLHLIVLNVAVKIGQYNMFAASWTMLYENCYACCYSTGLN